MKDGKNQITSSPRKPVAFSHSNTVIQESILILQSWFKSAGLDDLSVLSYDSHQKRTDLDFCRAVVLELFTRNCSQNLQLIIDFLHDNNKTSRFFANALAALITISLGHAVENNAALQTSITNILCISGDSFVYDFIVLCLNGDVDCNSIISLSQFGNENINNCYEFLNSEAAPVGSIRSFLSKVPLVNYFFPAHAIIKENDIFLMMFRGMVNSLINDINRIQADFWKSLSSSANATLGSPTPATRTNDSYNMITTVSSRSPTDHANSLPFDDTNNCVVMLLEKNSFDENERIIYETNVITPVNASYKYVCKYRFHLFSIKSKTEKLLSKLDPIKAMQNDASLARSPLVAPGLYKVKGAFKSLLLTLKQAEDSLLKFERVFIVFQMCQEEFISLNGLSSKFSDMALVAHRRPIELEEMKVLEGSVYKNLNMVHNLSEVFEKSFVLPDNELLKQKCAYRVLQVTDESKKFVNYFKAVESAYGQLAPILRATQECMDSLDGIAVSQDYFEKNYNLVEYSIRHIQNEVFAVAYYEFISFLDANEPEMLSGGAISPITLSVETEAVVSQNTIIANKLIHGMVTFVSEELYRFKESVRKDLLLLKKQREQQAVNSNKNKE
jgi:hypothetical protein